MDMSFAIQALSAQYIAKNRDSLSEMIINVPESVDNEVARRKLEYWSISVDELTDVQREYINGWNI